MKNKKSVYSITWNDAAYTFEKKIPAKFPYPQLTTGFIISENKKYINIAMNVAYDKKNGVLSAIDGFIIPAKCITKLTKTGRID